MDIYTKLIEFFGTTDVRFVDGGFAARMSTGQIANAWTFLVNGKPFDVWTKDGEVIKALKV